MKTIFSGIQPSGSLHVGNYIGALRQWVELQDAGAYQQIFCIVDLHAITVSQDPKRLKDNVRELTALYIACGIDPAKSTLFVQSDNPHHAYAAWLLSCITPTGWLNRMIQFKEKAGKNRETVSVGLYTYPILQAADILLYDTDLVPVGEDQVQHVEIAKDIARKFNRTFEAVLKIPKALIDAKGARIMSLADPVKKMSKSDANHQAAIFLLDSPDTVKTKIMRAVTDSGNEIMYDLSKKPALSNLIAIYARMSYTQVEDVVKDCHNMEYKKFKEKLTEVVNDGLRPIQEKYHRLMSEKAYLDSVIEEGGAKAKRKSETTVKKMMKVMGLGR